jgi:hypothetical protein
MQRFDDAAAKIAADDIVGDPPVIRATEERPAARRVDRSVRPAKARPVLDRLTVLQRTFVGEPA